MAQRTTGIEDKVHKIYQVPLSHDAFADIHAAYRDCAMKAISNPKRKPFRPPKIGKKKTELSSCSNAIEIIYHDQPYDSQLVADPWHHQEHHVDPKVWAAQWDEYTRNGNDKHVPEQHGHQPWTE